MVNTLYQREKCDGDSVGRFMAERCHGDSQFGEELKSLYAEWKRFGGNSGEPILSEKAFGADRALRAHPLRHQLDREPARHHLL